MSSRWIVPPLADLSESALMSDIFSDTTGAVELIDGNYVRVYFCARQLSTDRSATAQSIVVCKIVRPISYLPIAMEHLAQCLSAEVNISDRPRRGPFKPQLVRRE